MDSTNEYICPHCQNTFQIAVLSEVQTVTCPHCGNITAVEPAAPITEPAPTADAVPQPAAEPPQPAPLRRRRRSNSAPWIFVLIFLAGAAVAYAVFSEMRKPRGDVATGKNETASSKGSESAAPHRSTSNGQPWTDARNKSLRLGGFEVKVVRAELGQVLGRGSDNAVQTLADDGLQFAIDIRNITKSTLRYESWYAASRENDDLVQLTDSQGVSYPLLYFANVSQLRGHIAETEMVPSQRVSDIVIFEVPAVVDRNRITHFDLRLEGAVLKQRGRFQFRVPVSMVTNWK